jgi:hypothetical protein
MVLFERISRNGDRVSPARLAASGALLAIAALLLWAAAARAGRYHVYSCRMPDGGVAEADGWKSLTSGAHSYATDTCSQSDGALTAALSDELGRTTNKESATWKFEPSAQERLVGATLWRAGDADGGNATGSSYEFTLSGPEANSNPFSECFFSAGCENGVGSEAEPLAFVNRVQVPGADLGGDLYATAGCTGFAERTCTERGTDARGFAAVVFVFAADLVLEQQVDPQAGDVGGELASAASVSGTSDLSFTASDPGSGVYEALFSVDGQVVQRTVLNEDGGRCRDVGQTSDGLPAFLYVQPCPSSASADVGFDSELVGNGAHHLVVSVIDAAGNAATVLDRQITVDNPNAPGPANGVNASAQASLSVRWAGASTRHLSSGFGRRHEIVGKLAAAGGAPISSAMVEVAATPASAGAATAAMTSVHTDGEGRFVLTLPPGVSSRTLRFAYRSHIGDAAPAATATLTLSVRAGLTLSISPRTASVGRSIYFKGRLLGGPVPRTGKLLVLEARAPGGRWIEFDDVRTNARGVYRASYRFKFSGPASYQFRVLSEPESDYPYAQGASNTVAVSER